MLILIFFFSIASVAFLDVFYVIYGEALCYTWRSPVLYTARFLAVYVQALCCTWRRPHVVYIYIDAPCCIREGPLLYVQTLCCTWRDPMLYMSRPQAVYVEAPCCTCRDPNFHLHFVLLSQPWPPSSLDLVHDVPRH